MPLPDDLLKPIEGPNPSGINLRGDPLFPKIEEARREEPVRAWHDASERDRKVSNNPLVIELATEALTNKTKDLQLAAWLTEALLKERGFAGLQDGLAVCLGLVERFWDTLYPEIEDGDSGLRSRWLGFVGTALEIPVKVVPIVKGGRYGVADYQQSRLLGYENDRKKPEEKKGRALSIEKGSLAPEVFDKCFEDTPKAFYAKTEKDLDGCLQILDKLKKSCEAKFSDPDSAPPMTKLKTALEETREVVHRFLQKKREKEPDPIEESPKPSENAAPTVPPDPVVTGPPRVGVLISLEGSSEPADRQEAVREIAEAAAFLRQCEPHSPAAYLMLRGLRWGELRAAANQADPTRLEAPPTELRRHLKRLALERKWEDLLETAENAMALPCSRAWLDLQRLVVEACENLGSDYSSIAQAIRSELRTLLADLPQLLDATLMDDTPAANAETRAWLKSLAQEDASGSAMPEAAAVPSAESNGFVSRWPAQREDGYASALRALQEGREAKAFEILQQDIARQRSGRERFRRKMHLVEMCISVNKPNIAQPILDDLAAAIEAHKLDDWEEPAMVAEALATIMKLSQKIQGDQGQRQRLFERICRLDPAKALG